MTLTPGQAQEFGLDIAALGNAFKRVGRPVALIVVGSTFHAGHAKLVHAARGLPRGAVVVAGPPELDREPLLACGVDAIFRYTDALLWPHGRHTAFAVPDYGMEDVGKELTRLVAIAGAVRPSDVYLGEKDYELLVAARRAAADLHLPFAVHGIPPVRNAGGLVVSARNDALDDATREHAAALSAALTAGAFAAEHGADAVLDVARDVLSAAGIEPLYLELRGLDLGPAPATGDARLFVAAELGGVRLVDNVGVPLGVGFRGLSAGGPASIE